MTTLRLSSFPLRIAAFLGPLLLTAVPASAQILSGIVRDSGQRRLPGIEILLQKANRSVTTDSLGQFTLRAPDVGRHEFLARRIGYRPVFFRASLPPNDTIFVEITMAAAAVELEPIDITVQLVPRHLRLFEERRAMGRGAYLDAADLRKQDHSLLPDVIRTMRGILMYRGPNGEMWAMSRGDRCILPIYVDGVLISQTANLRTGQFEPVDLREFQVNQWDAVEVYAGPSTPAELSARSACGAIVLWTRGR